MPRYVARNLVFPDHVVHNARRHCMVCMFCGVFTIFGDGSYVVKGSDEGRALPLENGRNQVLQSVEVVSRLSVDGSYVLDLVLVQLLERHLAGLFVALSV
jgi:hypothetical protein